MNCEQIYKNTVKYCSANKVKIRFPQSGKSMLKCFHCWVVLSISVTVSTRLFLVASRCSYFYFFFSLTYYLSNKTSFLTGIKVFTKKS